MVDVDQFQRLSQLFWTSVSEPLRPLVPISQPRPHVHLQRKAHSRIIEAWRLTVLDKLLYVPHNALSLLVGLLKESRKSFPCCNEIVIDGRTDFMNCAFGHGVVLLGAPVSIALSRALNNQAGHTIRTKAQRSHRLR
jgi:hypothetical protein